MSYFYWRDSIAKPGIVNLLKLGIKLNKYKGNFSMNTLYN